MTLAEYSKMLGGIHKTEKGGILLAKQEEGNKRKTISRMNNYQYVHELRYKQLSKDLSENINSGKSLNFLRKGEVFDYVGDNELVLIESTETTPKFLDQIW